MAAYTERIIMETFQQMLEEMPFYKISVSALVKRCGISPNTFYYHYEDIYDLLETWVGKWLSQFTPKDDWRDSAKAFLRECQAHDKLVDHLLNYLSREQIEQALFPAEEDDLDLFYSFAKSAAGGRDIPEEKLRVCPDWDGLLSAITGQDKPVYIMPTYTAMLSLREKISRDYGYKKFWE